MLSRSSRRRNRHWGCDMLAFFRRSFRDASVPEARADQWARWEAWLAEQRKREALQKKELEADRTRISIVVWSWSRDCVTEWRQIDPPKNVPRDVRVWLAGLTVREIVTMASAGDAVSASTSTGAANSFQGCAWCSLCSRCRCISRRASARQTASDTSCPHSSSLTLTSDMAPSSGCAAVPSPDVREMDGTMVETSSATGQCLDLSRST
jgi:hypothetical protein